MIEGIRLKVCGLTTLADAELADRAGADYLGFILYPRSPRFVPLVQYEAMSARLPERKRVAVAVEPTAEELLAFAGAGFDFFQIHFRPELSDALVRAWSQAVGRDRLWLAPKLPPESDVPVALREAAKSILLDTFHAEGFGGSGRTGDWMKFARHQALYPENTWILAGGLDATNIGHALAQSGARFVDVNSGVESAPGVKSEEKLGALVAALRQAAAARR